DTTITVNKNIIINGQGSILDADKRFRIMVVNGFTVSLNNLTFINGRTDGGLGGAIYNYADLFVEDCQFSNITALQGGAIFTGPYSSLNVTNSIFNNISVTEFGGGVLYDDLSSGSVINCTFINIRSNEHGGAVLGDSDSNFKVINSTFINNTAAHYGGAIVANYRCAAEVINSTFINNIAPAGGAIGTTGIFTVINSNFTNNIATAMGSSIYTWDVLNVKDCNFNSVNTIGVAEIYVDSNTNANINLTNNNMSVSLLPVYNKGGKIISPTNLTFQNVTVDVDKAATLTAVLTDDNGNIIGSDTNVAGKVNDTDVNLVFDGNTKKFTAIYNPQAKGNYTISGNYARASNINVTNATLTVNTIPINEFKIDINSKIYCNFSGIITILPTNATGNVTIKVNGTKYGQLELENGSANWLFANLTPGVYNVTFEYFGDDYYSANSTSIIVDIDKATVDLKANVTDHIYGENTTVKVNVTGVAGTDLSGNVTVNIGQSSWNGAVNSDGIGEVVISGLAAGNHTADVKYLGNNNYT
ncbi:MAG: Ig-like domain repeat protein, partial [Bacteroidales bacterium]|nr:Ig-like domain repeat protein [Bacteroidales bacterium]